MKTGYILTAVALGITLTACSNYRDFDMGSSVSEMMASQTENPEGFQGESEGLDATKAEIALKVYRSDVSKPSEVRKSIGMKEMTE